VGDPVHSGQPTPAVTGNERIRMFFKKKQAETTTLNDSDFNWDKDNKFLKFHKKQIGVLAHAITCRIETLAGELVKGIHATDSAGNARAANLIREIHDLTEIAGIINHSNLKVEPRYTSTTDYAMKA
jgi:hypothetical protein